VVENEMKRRERLVSLSCRALAVIAGILAHDLEAQEPLDHARLLAAALTTVADSTPPAHYADGELVAFTSVQVDVEAYQRQRMGDFQGPTYSWLSDEGIDQAITLANETTGVAPSRFSPGTAERECQPGGRRACRIDPSILVLLPGPIHELPDGRLEITVRSTQMSPSEWRLSGRGHAVIFRLDGDTWRIDRYERRGAS
jgi:hypothetical protein